MATKKRPQQGDKWFIKIPTELCEICESRFPMYFVHNHLWLRFARFEGSTTKHYKSLCLKCLGIRMGRPVKVDDLKSGVPCNTLLMLWWLQHEPDKFKEEYGTAA